ncbi:hypothetical protein ACJ41O_014637 [Fusarium nematophilum]
MKHLPGLSLAGVAGLAGLSTAADIVFVTDLEIFTFLAPCASSAISYNVAMQTYSTMCGDSETELQECICSNTARFDDVAASISSDVTYGCGSSATDDLSSATRVMEQYCNQDTTLSFSSPTVNVVEAYITDLPELGYLPPCAQSALSYAVIGAAYSRCPEPAELNAPCVCSKEAVVSDISETIRSSVKYSCSNNEDVTSAYNFYDQFCAMNEGTTSFATPGKPPGDMTYYITALSQYQSLDDCAQSGIADAVLEQSSWLCGDGPQELASCVCIKSGMSKAISSSLTSMVKYYCDNTAIANVTSAIEVFEYFCSAAESKVVATVGESIVQSYPTASSGAGAGATGPAATGSRASGQGTATGSSGAPDETASSAAGDSKDKDKDEGDSEGGSSIVPIAGGIAGAVAAVAIAGGLFLFIRRKRQRESRGEEIPSNNDGAPDYTGKPELMGNNEFGAHNAGAGNGYYAPSNGTAFKPELDGGKPIVELPPNHAPTAELQSLPVKGHPSPYASPQSGYVSPMTPQGQNPGYAFNQNGQPVYEFPAHPQPAHHPQSGMGFQSGPVEAYELDSNVSRWAK